MPRPRKLPENEALERALLLFWERGYDRTSIGDLGDALGVGPSSIYNAFGSKAALFRKALQHYLQGHAAPTLEVLGNAAAVGLEPSLRELLHRAVALYTTKGQPAGCAMLEGGGPDGSADSEGGTIAREFRQETENALQAMIKTASEKEKLAATPSILAKYILGTMRGLSQLARDGTSRKDLLKIADLAASTCVLPR
jgi:AcrR family transcriptional regulator